MEMALNVQNSITDRLSIQLVDSCKTGDFACCGGWLTDLADFYNAQGSVVPWSNTNASFADGALSPERGAQPQESDG
jgi:hypothetical protein